MLHYQNRLHRLKPFFFLYNKNVYAVLDSSDVPCAVTEDPLCEGTFECISVKVEPISVAIETAVFKDPVLESGGVRALLCCIHRTTF